MFDASMCECESLYLSYGLIFDQEETITQVLIKNLCNLWTKCISATKV